jgi:hypothetical protein
VAQPGTFWYPMSSGEALLVEAGQAVGRSDYDLARKRSREGLASLATAASSDRAVEARLCGLLAGVERDKGRLTAGIALGSRAVSLAAEVGDTRTAASSAISMVVSAQIGADRSSGQARRAWMDLAARYVHRAARHVFDAADRVARANLAHRISRWYAVAGELELAQAEFRANVLPVAAEFEDRGLLLAYLLGEIRILAAGDPLASAPLIERYLDEADELRGREVSQPLRLMQHAVTHGIVHLSFGEPAQAETRLAEAKAILDRCGFDNAQYRRAVRQLARFS